MKKFFLSLAVFVMALCANAQTNQYFWYNGNLMMGNPIAQIDSVTFGNEETDSILIYLPRTIIKNIVMHDTIKVVVRDTMYIHDCDTTPKYMGHEYVDLGLPSGTLWASCDLGATLPEEAGDFYAWGETSARNDFSSSNYSASINFSDISGTQYDAATINWGSGWRMPTRTECEELQQNCTRIETVVNEVSVLKVTSNINGNFIYIPIVPEVEVEELMCNTLWSSTACGSSTAYRIYEWSYISYSWRYQGSRIRPVVNKEVVEPAQ